MDGLGNAGPIQGIGEDLFYLVGSFQGNGTSDPAVAGKRSTPGFVWTVIRNAAVGLYLVTLDAALALPELPVAIRATTQGAVLATDRCEAMILGEFVLASRSFQIQLHRAGTAFELPNTAGNRVNFELFVRNTTGK